MTSAEQTAMIRSDMDAGKQAQDDLFREMEECLRNFTEDRDLSYVEALERARAVLVKLRGRS